MDPNCPRLGPQCRARTQDGLSTSLPITAVAEMDPKPFLTSEPAWLKLKEYYEQNGKKIVIKDEFAKNSNRFDKFRLVLTLFFHTLLKGDRSAFCDPCMTLHI